jgi:hypothetical protein
VQLNDQERRDLVAFANCKHKRGTYGKEQKDGQKKTAKKENSETLSEI